MKTLSIDEASNNLARWLQLALAGEEIGIRTGGAIVALRAAGPLTEIQAHSTLERLYVKEQNQIKFF